MLKVTIKFTATLFFFLPAACNNRTSFDPDESQRRSDSISEARIDSAFGAINSDCDTLMLYQVPVLADSLFHGDTSYVRAFFDNRPRYRDADKKAEKVIGQLQADCDTNLLKETYKRAQLLKRPVRLRHKQVKV